MQKGFSSIVVLIILVVLIGGGLFYAGRLTAPKSLTPEPDNLQPSFSPSQPAQNDETASWKLYSNIEKGYSIKYPSDQFVRLVCPKEELVLQKRTASNENVDEKPLETCARDGRYAIEVQTYATPPAEHISSRDFTTTKDTITVAGQEASRYISTLAATCVGICSPEWSEEVRLMTNDKTYTFHLGAKDLSPLFEKMLSTFNPL